MTSAVAQEIAVVVGKAACPKGFVSAGGACGIKAGGKPDLALTLCPEGASAAGIFTTNLLRAAPVTISQAHLRASGGRARVVLINSGCANAATGPDGEHRAQAMVDAAAACAGCAREEVLIASTGLIGSTLPVDKIAHGAPALAERASSDGLMDFARAILTTDATTKTALARVEHEGRSFLVSGVAKGAGMIHPNMATMLAMVLTDAAVEPEPLDAMLRIGADRSFHRISVDGDTSTNDCVFALASGAAGEFPEALVREAMARVMRALAIQVVQDGEGARKLIHVRAHGAIDAAQALAVAQTVASSLLVRTAVAGGDPNWGRIIAAIGRADPRVDMVRLRVEAGGVVFYEHDAPTPDARAVLSRVVGGRDVVIDARLGLGDASDEFFSCDLTQEYVRINSEYST